MESTPSSPNNDDSFPDDVAALLNGVEGHLEEAARADLEYDTEVMRYEDTMMDKLEQRGMALAAMLRSTRDNIAPSRPLIDTVTVLDKTIMQARQFRAFGASVIRGRSLDDVEHDAVLLRHFGAVLNMVASRKRDGDTGHYTDMQHRLALEEAFKDADYGRYSDDVREVIDELFS